MHRPLSSPFALCAAAPVATGVACLALSGEGAPAVIQIAPRGRVTTRDGRSFSFDPEALVARFEADGISVPIDFNHATESPFGDDAGARGWVDRLEARPEGLFAQVTWLDAGREAVESRRYRYVSPAFRHEPDGRATWLKSVALVTSPALSLPALAGASLKDLSMDKDIAEALGLASTADAAAACVSIAALKARAAQADAAAQEVARLAAEIAQRDRTEADLKAVALVDAAVTDGKVAPAAKAEFLALAKADPAGAAALIAKLPAMIAKGADTAATVTAGGDALSAEEATLCARLGLTPEQFTAAKAG